MTSVSASPLRVVRDLINGGRHSRRTIADQGVSLPTADRWIAEIAATIPGARTVRIGKTTWLEWAVPKHARPDVSAREVPTKPRDNGEAFDGDCG